MEATIHFQTSDSAEWWLNAYRNGTIPKPQTARSGLQCRQDNSRILFVHISQSTRPTHSTAAQIVEELQLWTTWAEIDAVGLTATGCDGNTILYRAKPDHGQERAISQANAALGRPRRAKAIKTQHPAPVVVANQGEEAMHQAANLLSTMRSGGHATQPQDQARRQQVPEAAQQDLTAHHLQAHNRLQDHQQGRLYDEDDRVKLILRRQRLLAEETLRVIGQQHLEDVRERARRAHVHQDEAVGGVVLRAMERIRAEVLEQDNPLFQALSYLDDDAGMDGSIGTSDWYEDDEDLEAPKEELEQPVIKSEEAAGFSDGVRIDAEMKDDEDNEDDPVLRRRRARVVGRWTGGRY